MSETNTSQLKKNMDNSQNAIEHEFYTNIPKGYVPGKTKFIIVTGSVISGVGKGTFTSCLGSMLNMFYGLNVVPMKFECYVNYDAGTLNPFRHGEVFVLDDGTETDLDLGTYERMLNKNLTKDSFITYGKIFKTIIDKERKGVYLGRDVEFIPHVTGEIKSFVRRLAMNSNADIATIEIGGTVGEIQNSLYLEAMRELAYEEGKGNVCFVNVTYVLRPNSLGEQKSKAAQLGIKTLMGIGIQPHIIACRSEQPITEKIKEKISIYSNVPVSRIIDFSDTSNIYKVPIYLEDIGIGKGLQKILNFEPKNPIIELEKWKNLERNVHLAKKLLMIGITGKYTDVHDSYISIIKALEHSACYFNSTIKIKWIETTKIKDENDVKDALKDVNGIIVPGGFGSRGTEGKIRCIKYAREKKIPFFGLCFGFQMALVEFARNVCGLEGANSTEIDSNTSNPVIDILPEQKEINELGGTMRLGGHWIQIKENTIAHKLYGETRVRLRFRHRFECNPKYIEILEKNGLVFSGKAPDKNIMQVFELPDHPFFIATQFHPEFTSKPLSPDPLYMEFIKTCSNR